MRFTRSAIAAGLATAASVMASDASSSDVLVLSASNFTNTIVSEPLMLVEYYAPWCGHCKALAPEYAAAAKELQAKGIKLAKVDCTQEEAICAEQQVEGYPTLKVIRSGVSSEYSGTRKTAGIVSYMTKQALPAVSTVSAENFTEFKSKDKVVAIAYLSEKDTADYETINKVAEYSRDNYLFGVAYDEALAKEARVTVPALVLYRQFDEPEVKFEKSLTEDEIVSFLKSESIPLIDELGPENFMAYAESGLPLAYLFAEPDAKDLSAQVESLKPLAKENRGKINFVWIDAVKFVNHAKEINLQGENWPSFAIHEIHTNLKYPLEDVGKDTVSKVSDFVNKYNGGELKPKIKSEPVPKDQDGPVFVLVADQFDEVVGDNSKDMLVEFYAPWCGHCKNLAPTFDSLGEKYSNHKEKVLIAKMDATANDIPHSSGILVRSFPTIKFRAAGSSEWVDYTADRTLDSFVEYIATHGKNKVDVSLDSSNKTDQPDSAAKEPEPIVHEEL